jgi:hypothetical protein
MTDDYSSEGRFVHCHIHVTNISDGGPRSSYYQKLANGRLIVTFGASAKMEFDVRVQGALESLTPAEQRMARFFVDQKKAVLLGSAAEIAHLAGTSDATVVRTARSLGLKASPRFARCCCRT